MNDESNLFQVSHSWLRILAALVWYAGGIVLLIKGISLLIEADSLKPETILPLIAALTGIFLGSLKARFLFNKSCKRNLDRIYSLEKPRIWQFFKPGFFLFLACMILLGISLSKLSHNNYPFLIGVAIIDLSISTALIMSSHVFWKNDSP